MGVGLDGEGDDPEGVTAEGGEPEEPAESVDQGEDQDEDREIAICGLVDEGLESASDAGGIAQAAQDDEEGQDAAEDGAGAEPEVGAIGLGTPETDGDAGKDGGVDNLIANDVEPLAQGGFLENGPGDIAIHAIDDGGDLEKDGGKDGDGR